MEYGYVRVSAKDQNVERQIDAMHEAQKKAALPEEKRPDAV